MNISDDASVNSVDGAGPVRSLVDFVPLFFNNMTLGYFSSAVDSFTFKDIPGKKIIGEKLGAEDQDDTDNLKAA